MKIKKLILAFTFVFGITALTFAQTESLEASELQEVNKAADGFSYGAQFVTGVSLSLIMKPYIVQEADFKMKFNSVVGMDIGLLAMENLITRTSSEPWVYTGLVSDFTAGCWYIGGGLLVPMQFSNGFEPSWIVRTGADWGKWNVGQGKLNVRTGISLSPTVYIVEADENADSSEQLGAGLGSFFGTIFNTVKFDAGVTYYLNK